MKQKYSVWIVYCALIAGLVAGSFLAGKAIARPRIASAQDAAGSNAPDAPNASNFHCTDINNVAAFDNRIHLRCATANPVGTDTVYYYAYANDAAHATTANEMLAIGNTAFALGKGVYLYYNADPALNPPGCNTGDCRGLVGVSMAP
jgi:hypothetical protein